jgi:hypothetical protein
MAGKLRFAFFARFFRATKNFKHVIKSAFEADYEVCNLLCIV